MLKTLKRNWEFKLLIFLSIFTIWPLLVPGYFSHHDNLHMFRVYEMRQCLADFQIPCRWSANSAFGYGSPLFNFYNPLIYYIGALMSYFVGYVGAVKLLFFFALISGPIAVYFLAREFWGKLAGLAAGALYMFVPYRALDAYVRGALAELFALSLIPVILHYSYRFGKHGGRGNFAIMTTLMACLMLTHNVSLLIWTPLLFVWIAYFCRKRIIGAAVSVLFSVGISLFFLLPAIMEKGLVTTSSLTMGDLDFHVHFSSLYQLFLDSFWGYGASVFGPHDILSLQLGWPHWWLVIAAFTFAGFSYINKRKLTSDILVPLSLSTLFVVAIFMTHNRSTLIWETVPEISFVQFPWRFLGVAALASSLCAAYLVRNNKALVLVVVLLALALNVGYFSPEKFYVGATDRDFLTGDFWEEAQKGAVLDYLPLRAKKPVALADGVAKFVRRGGDLVGYSANSNSFEFKVVRGSPDWVVEVPVLNFPNWEVVGGQIADSESGTILVTGSGDAVVRGVFRNTPTRTAANIVSLASIVVFAYYFIYGKNNKIFK